jgi:hypothetical protein
MLKNLIMSQIMVVEASKKVVEHHQKNVLQFNQKNDQLNHHQQQMAKGKRDKYEHINCCIDYSDVNPLYFFSFFFRVQLNGCNENVTEKSIKNKIVSIL